MIHGTRHHHDGTQSPHRPADRRQTEQGPPTAYERRRAVESRQPELTELHLSEEELRAMGFTQEKPEPRKPA